MSEKISISEFYNQKVPIICFNGRHLNLKNITHFQMRSGNSWGVIVYEMNVGTTKKEDSDTYHLSFSLGDVHSMQKAILEFDRILTEFNELGLTNFVKVSTSFYMNLDLLVEYTNERNYKQVIFSNERKITIYKKDEE